MERFCPYVAFLIFRGRFELIHSSQSYEIAAHDAAPRYWETTVLTPQGVLGPDDICVDGLPVGNLFGFAWNLLVSMSFQFVGESIRIVVGKVQR